MVTINEFLANPKGKDAGLEWIELKNSQGYSQNIAGWSLVISGKKRVALTGVLQPNEYKVLTGKLYHFSLRNTDEIVVLKNSEGVLVDTITMTGKAAEGKSFGRTVSQELRFLTPTPAEENKEEMRSTATLHDQAVGVPINSRYSSAHIQGAAVVTAIVITLAVLYILRWNEKSAHTNPFAPSDKE